MKPNKNNPKIFGKCYFCGTIIKEPSSNGEKHYCSHKCMIADFKESESHSALLSDTLNDDDGDITFSKYIKPVSDEYDY